MQGVHLRKYGAQTTIDFEVYETDGVDLRTDWVPAQADCEVMKDGGVSTMCTNTATDEGSTYSIVLTATEMEAARIVLKVVDAAAKVFLDKVVMIETYGNASAQHAMDFNDAVRGGLTALPNANADAAGGLPISDAGGLALDTMVGTDGKCVISTDAQDLSGTLDVNTKTLTAGAVTAAAVATDAIDADALAADAVNEIWAKAMSDLAQGAPSATASVLTAINYLYEALRNKVTTTSTEMAIYKDDGTTKAIKAVLADDGSTFTKNEFGSGA